MTDIHTEFKAAAEIRAQQIRDAREAKQDPDKTTRDNADAFANYIEQQINEQRANGTRIDTTNL